jgi:hypothetical protein
MGEYQSRSYKVGCEGVNWSILAHDSSEWHLVTNTAISVLGNKRLEFVDPLKGY